jgi:hypothetical protein
MREDRTLVTWKATLHRRVATAAAVAAAAVLILGGTVTPAAGEPSDPDGGNQALTAKLDEAARAYADAKGRLDASKVQQVELDQSVLKAQLRLDQLASEVGTVAAAAYRGERLSMGMMLLQRDERSDHSAGALLHDAATVQFLAARDDREIRELNKARKEYAEHKTALDDAVKQQEKQVVEMDRRKKEIEAALGNPKNGTAVGGNQKASANSAPRNANGSFPSEGCSVKDPTTSGCISPRMLNALQQARAAGFTHFTACHRSGGGGDHPRGKACDFSANATTFANVRAAGADKQYGDRLAGYFIANADRLGVVYVIWYKQIWMPGTGWKAYTSGGGDVASDHYNHVHVSVS